MEQILFLALVAVVGLLRWFSQMAEERRNREAERRATPAPNAPIPRAPAETEEERIRRFMEALGVPSPPAQTPPSSRPPERPAPPAPPKEPTRPARKVMPVDPFPVPRRAPVARSAPEAAPAEPPPLPQSPPLVPPPPLVPRTASAAPMATPLPKRETTVLADVPAVRSAAEFEVRDVTEVAEDAWRSPAPPSRGNTTAQRERGQATLASRLATHAGLRDAMVLREIFGPPRSMQPLEPHRPEMI
jgi:hypothetical protein